ncbi:MAG: erythromycin esterase family protein [Bacteroidota bacterium]
MKSFFLSCLFSILATYFPSTSFSQSDWAALSKYCYPISLHGEADQNQRFEAFKHLLKGRKVVAMGEATHGTREFFEMKHDVMRFLATEMGYRIFTIEAGYAEALKLDRYVRTGKGDPDQLIGKMGYWCWNTEEVLEMVEWMRAFNKGRAAADQIRFLGVDMQTLEGAVHDFITFFKSFPTLPAQDFLPILERVEENRIEAMPEAQQRELQQAAADIVAFLDKHADFFSPIVSAGGWEAIRMEAKVFQQTAGRPQQRNNRSYRDSCMAENLLRILQDSGPEAKAFFWAHNGHVRDYTDPLYGGFNAAGNFLRAELKEKYYVIGFDFAGGEFRAGGNNGLQVWSRNKKFRGTQQVIHSNIGTDNFLFDLQNAQQDPTTRAQVEALNPLTSIGAVYFPKIPSRSVEKGPPHPHYDALICMAQTTPARQLTGTMSNYGALRQNIKVKKLTGKPYRFTAMVRVRHSRYGGNGYLQVIQSRKGELFAAKMTKSKSVNTVGEWLPLTVEGTILDKMTDAKVELRIQGDVAIELANPRFEIQEAGQWQVHPLLNQGFATMKDGIPQDWKLKPLNLETKIGEAAPSSKGNSVILGWK